MLKDIELLGQRRSDYRTYLIVTFSLFFWKFYFGGKSRVCLLMGEPEAKKKNARFGSLVFGV